MSGNVHTIQGISSFKGQQVYVGLNTTAAEGSKFEDMINTETVFTLAGYDDNFVFLTAQNGLALMVPSLNIGWIALASTLQSQAA